MAVPRPVPRPGTGVESPAFRSRRAAAPRTHRLRPALSWGSVSERKHDRSVELLWVAESEFEFSYGERQALAEIEALLRRIADWPPDSPLAFVLGLASRTKGKFGEMLLDRFASHAGQQTQASGSVDFDRTVAGKRFEVKFSTEDPPRFQQVRDPRQPDGSLKYEYLLCISGRPHGLVYWLFPASVVGELMDDQLISVQHAMSDTKWFFPSRLESDAFAAYRYLYEELIEALRALS